MVVFEYLIVNLAQSSCSQVMARYADTTVTYQCLKLVTCSVTVSFQSRKFLGNKTTRKTLPLLYYSAKCVHECQSCVELCPALNMAEVVGTVVVVVADYAFGQLP